MQYPQKGDKIVILNSNSQNQLPYICCKQNTGTIIGMKLEKKKQQLDTLAPDPKHRSRAYLTVGPKPLHSATASAEKLVLGRCRLATKNVFPGATNADVDNFGLGGKADR